MADQSNPEPLAAEADRLFAAGRLREAYAAYERLATEHAPTRMVLNRLGEIAFRSDQMHLAKIWLARSLRLDPRQPSVMNNLGLAMQQAGDHDHALACYDKALALQPGYSKAWLNRAIALAELGRHLDALEGFNRAIEAEPAFADARLGKAELLLLMGDYAQGWALYESRWETRFAQRSPLHAAAPLWSGDQPVAGKTVLVHPEWGLGDFLMMARYVPLLRELGARVVLSTPQPLSALFREFEGVQVVPQGEPLPQVDLQCPIMSLPHAFKTRVTEVPANFPYLSAPSDRMVHWRDRLGPPRAPRVGLMWSGKSNRNIDRNTWRRRTLPLAMLAPLTAQPCELHSLQKEIPRGEASAIEEMRIVEHMPNLADLADTAALIRHMDLVISIDTSVAHLAGGLGVPLWVMLPAACDYRWTSSGASTPWYPAAKLFRQERPGDWESVVDAVAVELRGWIALRPD